MSDNIYTPPQSDVGAASPSDTSSFYVVSPRKMTVLYFATLGVYTIYWFYRNWHLQNRAHNLGIWPIPRGLFSIFFTHSLFSEIQRQLDDRKIEYHWPFMGLAHLYVAGSIISFIADRLSYNEVGSPWTDAIAFGMLFVLWIPLHATQKAINISERDPEGTYNNQFTFANIVFIILGALLWSATVLGYLVIFGIVAT